jgi:hypothetical protein
MRYGLGCGQFEDSWRSKSLYQEFIHMQNEGRGAIINQNI